jgi:hypothetical protein
MYTDIFFSVSLNRQLVVSTGYVVIIEDNFIPIQISMITENDSMKSLPEFTDNVFMRKSFRYVER